MQRTVLLLEFCTSVRPFVKRVHCDKTAKSSVSISVYQDHTKRNLFSFLLLQQQLPGMVAFQVKYRLKLTYPLQKRPSSSF